MSSPNQDGVYSQQNFATDNTEFNSLMFQIERVLSSMNISVPVEIVAVHTTPMPSFVGTVDVQPLIEQLDGAGQTVEHSTIFGVPFMRLQGGTHALVVDPSVGDTGLCVFADRDISNVKTTGKAGPAATQRRFDFADAVYLGCTMSKIVPTNYVEIKDTGIDIVTLGAVKQHALSVETIATDVSMTAATVSVTVPEFTIIGNLHVTGLVHCTWQGELVAVKYGGSGADLSATGGPGMVVKQSTVGEAFSVGPVESSEIITPVTLGDTFATNQPFTIVSGLAQHATAVDSSLPQIDGVTLESGVSGARVPAAMNMNQLYQTPLTLPGSDGDDLFLGKDGTITTTLPTYGAGYFWLVPLMRRVSSISFVFNPESPTQLA